MTTFRKAIDGALQQGKEPQSTRIRRTQLNNESYKEMEVMLGTERLIFNAEPINTISQPAKKIPLLSLPGSGAVAD